MPRMKNASVPQSKPATKKKGGKRPVSEPVAGEVVYPSIELRLLLASPELLKEGEEAHPLTVEIAKELLGWEEDTGEEKFKTYLFSYVDPEGQTVRVRCTNNLTNRPYDAKLADDWRLEILRGKWQFNGEPIIIDRLGMVQDGQHRLIGLVLASIDWLIDQRKSKADRVWSTYWDGEPYIETLVVCGISNRDEVVNTIGTGKRRSFADALYRDSRFVGLPAGSRERVAKWVAEAVRVLWFRTAQDHSSLAPRRPHSESFEFFNNHIKLLDCVEFIRQETEGKKSPEGIHQFMNPGFAAALLYLMGSSASDSDKYDKVMNESVLDWSLYDKAEAFWTDISSNGKKTEALREELIQIPKEIGGRYGLELRCGLIIKAWNLFSDGTKLTRAAIQVEKGTNELGQPILAEIPRLGGIDVAERAV